LPQAPHGHAAMTHRPVDEARNVTDRLHPPDDTD